MMAGRAHAEINMKRKESQPRRRRSSCRTDGNAGSTVTSRSTSASTSRHTRQKSTRRKMTSSSLSHDPGIGSFGDNGRDYESIIKAMREYISRELMFGSAGTASTMNTTRRRQRHQISRIDIVADPARQHPSGFASIALGRIQPLTGIEDENDDIDSLSTIDEQYIRLNTYRSSMNKHRVQQQKQRTVCEVGQPPSSDTNSYNSSSSSCWCSDTSSTRSMTSSTSYSNHSNYSNRSSGYSSQKLSSFGRRYSERTSVSSLSSENNHYFVPISHYDSCSHGQTAIKGKRNLWRGTSGNRSCSHCRNCKYCQHCNQYENLQSLPAATTTFHEWEQLRLQSPSSVDSSIFELVQFIAPDSQMRREAYLRRFKEVPCHVILTCPNTC